MTTMLTIIHAIVCVFLTLVVLLQQGAKQGMGAAFGGGSSTVFGGRGANTFLAKLTAGAAGLFMVTSLSLSYISSPRGIMDDPADDGAPKVAAEKTGADKPAAAAKDEPAAPAGAPKADDAPPPVEPAPAK